MKRMLLAVILILSLFLSGCSVAGFDPEGLMSPPKATGDQAGIQRELEDKAVGNSISLKYPRSGEYRTAIVMKDLTGDGKEDAIIFYRSNDEGAGTHFMLLSKENDQWHTKGDYTGPGNDVDCVNFGDLNGDGVLEIIVGWQNIVNAMDKSVTIHKYNAENIEKPFETIFENQEYNQIVVNDFDGDGKDEIVCINLDTSNSFAEAEMFKYYETNTVQKMANVLLDGMVTSYANVQVGNINKKRTGIVLDGYINANTLVTEIIYYDKASKQLVAPITALNDQYNFNLKRATQDLSKDINADGVIEIPFVTEMPGQDENLPITQRQYMTSWKYYNGSDDEAFKNIMDMYINYEDRYYFIFPEDWRESVTARYDPVLKVLSIYEWIPSGVVNEGRTGDLLVEIQAITSEEWKKGNLTEGFTQVMEKNGYVYTARVSKEQKILGISLIEVGNYLRAIAEIS